VKNAGLVFTDPDVTVISLTLLKYGVMYRRRRPPTSRAATRPMFFIKLFRKSCETRPRITPESTLAEELARRVSAIEFRPTRGFLKDQRQPRRSDASTA
jgi:hypothetical protein